MAIAAALAGGTKECTRETVPEEHAPAVSGRTVPSSTSTDLVTTAIAAALAKGPKPATRETVPEAHASMQMLCVH